MITGPFVIVDRKDLAPVCPHCEKDLREVYRQSRGAGLIVGRNCVFFCPHCRKVLGFAQSRMI